MINPPIVKEGQSSGGAFIDMMAPKFVPQSIINEHQFQKATSFDQPKQLIEIHQSTSASEQMRPPQYTPQQQVTSKIPPPYQDVESFYPPQQNYQKFGQQENNNAWQQIQQFPNQQPSFSQVNQQMQPPVTPPPNYYDQDYFQPQSYQQDPPPQQQIQNNQPASQPSFSLIQQQEQKQQQRQIQQQQQLVQQQQHQQKQMDQKQKQQEYLITLQQDMKEKEEKKRREKEDRVNREKEELQKNLQYNPFGKAGAGAPLKDVSGNVIVNRKQNQDQQQQMMRIQQKPPTPVGGYQQQFLPLQNSAQPQNVYYNQQQQNGFQTPPPQAQQQYGNMGQIQPLQNMIPQEYMNFGGPPPNMMNMQNNNNFGGGQNQFPQNMMQQIPIQINPQVVQQYNEFDQYQPPLIQQKYVAPPPQIKNQFQQENNQQEKGLRIGNYNENEPIRQKEQKQELSSVLKQQMEEQKRRKDEEIKKKKDEERREEERVNRERQEIDRQFKEEENKQKKKFSDVQKANAQLIEAKDSKSKKVQDEQSFQNFVIDKPGQKADLFGNNKKSINIIQDSQDNQSFDQGQNLPPPVYNNQHLQRQSTFEGGEPNPQMSQTRIIKDISTELKHNFKEEIGKLRDEMNSQQRQFREQIQRMQIDQLGNIAQQKQEQTVMSELEKIKMEIQSQREKERMEQNKLLTALERHNPNRQVAPIEVLQNYDKAGSFPSQHQNNAYGGPSSQFNNQAPIFPPVNMNGSFYNNKRGQTGSRLDSRESQRKKEINNYEKMFFGGASGKAQHKSASLQREEPPTKAQPPQYNIKEEKMVRFNQDYYAPQQQDYQPSNNNYESAYQPKIVKRDDSNINNMTMKSLLNGESTLLPINYQEYQQQDQDMIGVGRGMNGGGMNQNQPTDIGAYQNKENSQQNNNKQQLVGNSYLDHIKGIGQGAGGSHMYLGTDSSENTMEFVNKIVNGKDDSAEKFLNKLDNRFADKADDFNFNFPSIPQYDGMQNDYIKKQGNQQNNYNTQGGDFKVTRQDSYTKNNNAMGGYGQGGVGEGTINTMGTLNSIDLEHINQKYDDRLAKYGVSLDSTQNNNNNNRNDYNQMQSRPAPQKPGDTNDELKKLDNLLFDLLREAPQKGPQPSYGSQQNQDSRQPYNNGGQYGQNKLVHINQSNNAENIAKMRGTRDQFMAPSLGLIDEDGGEDYDGTFKEYKGGMPGNGAFKMPSDIRRYDSLLDSTNLALD